MSPFVKVHLINVRAAVAGYLLRRWNVDCTKDNKLERAEYHLWLSNPQALYGVKNLVLAPGYEGTEQLDFRTSDRRWNFKTE